MTTNALRRKGGEVTPPVEPGIAIGETDAHVFDCPSCARPLPRGTTRCQSCGTRLILGVAVKRAGTILALGLAFGVLIGGAATAAAIALSVRQPAAVASVPTTAVLVPTSAPVVSVAPVVPVVPAIPAAPSIAVAALSGTAVVNGRISVDAATLAVALSTDGTRTIDIARALRSLAADAALGTDLVGRIAPWTDAAPVMTQLDGFYGAMTTTARDGLRASLTNDAAYRAAGARMLTLLASLANVDAASRTLAATVDLDLPPVALPGDPAASTAP